MCNSNENSEKLKYFVESFFKNNPTSTVNDLYMSAPEILDMVDPHQRELWRDYVKAQAEVEEKFKAFCEDMGITYADYQAMVDYYDNIEGAAMADEYDDYLEDYYSSAIMEDVIWQMHNC